MFTYKHVCGLRAALVSAIFTRNKGTNLDPVQQLFLDKIKEYKTKSPDESFVEPTPSILKELQNELDKLDKNYGGGKGVDMAAFPVFKFEEAKLDDIDALPETDKKDKKKSAKKKKKKKAVKKPPPKKK